ncbi:MAG: OmpH family outer membrane protein [Bacteroidales bacterium]|nr:OmpH family outer membrane protein [Bacteroidales bacterium]
MINEKDQIIMKTAKTILLLALLMILGVNPAEAQGNQKFAFVDTEYILQNIPEYGDAQEQINQLSSKWEKEIKALRTKVDALQREYQTESVLLTDEQKRKKEEEIAAKEQEIMTLQMDYFGPEGQLFTKRIELIQPIQEKIYNAINQLALLKNYAFVFDKASGTTVLYCNEKNDISDDVLDEIGNVMQTVRKEDRKRSNGGSNSSGGNNNGKGSKK